MTRDLDVSDNDAAGMRVSFAQNGEDVRLWRAFDSLERGFYVEVGGWDPVEHSVSRSFYLRGWSGLIVEPVVEHATRFAEMRPRDRVLPIAAGAQSGFVELHAIVGTGLSTTSPIHAARHESGGFSSGARSVAVRPLRELLDEHAPPDIHFLVVDVEGAESDVLEGGDFSRHRPWVVIVEATDPGTPNQSVRHWEHLLVDSGYEFVVFDGLNCFYVAEEHRELADLLALAPNVFDRYRPAEWVLESVQRRSIEVERSEAQDALHVAWVTAMEREQTLQSQLQNSRGQVERLRATLERLEAEREAQMSALLSSRSWVVTKPLRRMFGSG